MEQKIEVGGFVKVLLPGERPWVEVTEIGEGAFKGRISNRLITDMPDDERDKMASEWFEGVAILDPLHDYHQGDEIWFTDAGDGLPVPINEVRKAVS
jgi:hypothetical protein